MLGLLIIMGVIGIAVVGWIIYFSVYLFKDIVLPEIHFYHKNNDKENKDGEYNDVQ